MQRLSVAVRDVAVHFPRYLTVILLFHAPWLFLIAAAAMAGVLTADAVDALIGICGVFALPFSNGLIVWYIDRHAQGERPPLATAVRAVAPRWRDLLVAYLSVGFILIGAVALSMIPVGVLVAVLRLESPFWFVPLSAAAVIYVMTRYIFLDYLIICEGKAGWVARRSAPGRTKGHMLSLLLAVVLMPAPLLFSEFGYDKAADWVAMSLGLGAYLPHPQYLVTAVFTIVATLLYVIPQVYFYQAYTDLKLAPEA